MKDIAIFGAGGFGREVACLINRINLHVENEEKWNIVGFFDDAPNLKGTHNEYGEVLGGMDKLNSWSSPLSVALAIGSPAILKLLVSKIKNHLVKFPNLIAPDATFLDNRNVKIGKGNIICSQCIISTNVTIGDFNIVNCCTIIGHDASLGNYNAIMPSVNISGGVQIGNENYFGVSSVVLQYLKIGNNTKIGANSTIFQKTKDGNTYIGNPAYILNY